MGTGHDHAGDAGRTPRSRLLIAFSITLSFFLIEVVGSVITGSLALLVDSTHMLTDVIGLAMAVTAAQLMNRPPTETHTWGLRRAEVLGALAQAALLLAVGLFLYAPLILPTDASALTDILIEAYTPYYQALQALALLFVLLFCLGRGFWALLAFLTFAAVFLYGSFHTERLYIGLGFGTAYAWLNMSIIWKALFQAGLFSLLGRCWLGFAAILIDGLALWYVGLPLNLPVSVLPAAAFPVFCGMMATYDRYRKDVLRETFWW